MSNDYLIISNMCLNYWAYSIMLKCEYRNPFCAIPKEHLVRFVNNFYNIDYGNVEFQIFNGKNNFNNKIQYADYTNYVYARVNNWLDIHFIHDNNLEKLKFKYFKRLDRMRECIKNNYKLRFLFYATWKETDISCYFNNDLDIMSELLKHDNVTFYTKLTRIYNRFKNYPNICLVPYKLTNEESKWILNDYRTRLK